MSDLPKAAVGIVLSTNNSFYVDGYAFKRDEPKYFDGEGAVPVDLAERLEKLPYGNFHLINAKGEKLPNAKDRDQEVAKGEKAKNRKHIVMSPAAKESGDLSSTEVKDDEGKSQEPSADKPVKKVIGSKKVEPAKVEEKPTEV